MSCRQKWHIYNGVVAYERIHTWQWECREKREAAQQKGSPRAGVVG